MTAIRTGVALLTLIPLGTLVFLSQHYAMGAFIGVAIVIGSFDRVRVTLSPRRERIVYAAIALFFLLKWLIAPPLTVRNWTAGISSITFIDFGLAYHVSQAILAGLAAMLFLRRRDAFPRTVPLFAAVAMVMAGTLPAPSMSGYRDLTYQWAAMALTMTAALYFMATTKYRVQRRPPVALTSGVLIAIGVLAWSLSFFIYRYGDRADLWLVQMVNPPVGGGVGFPEDGRLNKITGMRTGNEKEIMLRVTSESAPGYLRGKAYDTYIPGRWTDNPKFRTVRPLVDAAETPGGEHWFPLAAEIDPKPNDEMRVERAAKLRGNVFTRLESERIAAALPQLNLDTHDIVIDDQVEPGAPYRVAGSNAVHAPPSSEERALLLALPPDLDARIPQIAQELSAGASTDIERIASVVAHLRTTCEYDLSGVQGKSKDPAAAFLFETHKGHCELFATSAALLLRASGVPCRYVTGLVTIEQNEFGRYWVARNRDAHAWVEAYVDGDRWEIVEATPGDGVPTGEPERASQFWDYLKQRVKAIVAAIRAMNTQELLRAALDLLLRAITSVPGAIVVAGIAVFVVWRILRKRRSRKNVKRDPTADAFHKLLDAMDTRMAQAGLVRGASETLHRFATRVEKVGKAAEAGWYRAYAEKRYDPAVRSDATNELQLP